MSGTEGDAGAAEAEGTAEGAGTVEGLTPVCRKPRHATKGDIGLWPAT